jgi:adenylyl- and sulfurtransferase ThiI
MPHDASALAQMEAAATSAPQVTKATKRHTTPERTLHAVAQAAWDAAVSTWRLALGGGTEGAAPTFCVRACRREKRNRHDFNRHQVEVAVGGAIHERFGWQVCACRQCRWDGWLSAMGWGGSDFGGVIA